MKRINNTSRATELFIKAGLTAAIAAALLLPVSINANGAEAVAPTRAPFVSQPSNTLPLPPIPHLSTMPWLGLERPHGTLKTDILLRPEGPQSFFANGSVTPMWLSSGLNLPAHTNTDG
jgi:hypothetical protein